MLKTEFAPAADRNSRRLLIALHGLGDSTAGYRWLPSTLQLPWMNYLLVNAPDPYYGGFSWYDFSGEPGPGIVRSRKLLFDLLQSQQARGFPAQETILFGFSQGCLMTWEIGFRFPHRLAGLIGISGYVHEPERAITELSSEARHQRFLITHGTQDPLIPFAQVREQINTLKAAGLRIEWHEFVKAHTIAGDAELEVIRDFVTASFSEQGSRKDV